MLVTRPAEIRSKQKELFGKAYSGETVVVSRPRGENVVIIGEKEYNRLKMENRILAYAVRLYSQGKTINIDDLTEDEKKVLLLVDRLDKGIASGDEDSWIGEEDVAMHLEAYIREKKKLAV